MDKLNKADFEAIKAAVVAAMPAGWCWKLANGVAGHVKLEIQAAPVDLLAVDAAIYGGERRDYVKICPSGYEDRDDVAIGALWRALHSRNTVQFDAAGYRTGRWYAVELWVGHWKRPFQVLATV